MGSVFRKLKDRIIGKTRPGGLKGGRGSQAVTGIAPGDRGTNTATRTVPGRRNPRTPLGPGERRL
jgi:hypothetical protein